jgi:hypothetical protein
MNERYSSSRARKRGRRKFWVSQLGSKSLCQHRTAFLVGTGLEGIAHGHGYSAGMPHERRFFAEHQDGPELRTNRANIPNAMPNALLLSGRTGWMDARRRVRLTAACVLGIPSSHSTPTTTFSFSALARSLGEGNLAICCQRFLCSTSSLLLSYPSSHLNTTKEGRENNHTVPFFLSTPKSLSSLLFLSSRSLSLFPFPLSAPGF